MYRPMTEYRLYCLNGIELRSADTTKEPGFGVIKLPPAQPRKMMGLEMGPLAYQGILGAPLPHTQQTHPLQTWLSPYLGKKNNTRPRQNVPQIPRNQEAAEELLRERKYIAH